MRAARALALILELVVGVICCDKALGSGIVAPHESRSSDASGAVYASCLSEKNRTLVLAKTALTSSRWMCSSS